MLYPTFTQSLLAGAIAGTTADFIFFPIDTIKTRLQSAQGFLCAGGFRGVYHGIGSVIIGGAPGACLIRVPTEVVKTRAQTATFGKSPLPSLIAAKRTFEVEGLRGFYRGFGITVARDLPFTVIELPLYEFLKVRLARYLGRETLHPYEAAICGSVAGGLAAAATTPLDVLKTRVMLDMRTDQKSTFMRHFSEIRQKEGLRVLFNGAVPRVSWMSIGGAVWLGIYEYTIQELMQQKPPIPRVTAAIL
ncbi:hypothetical protein Clacol_008047 [Clathrus columnatus]|uniref:S-adenosylmethionine transporter n=1 Tax=Clathrus columnatus TaxID=1419009 RepID=A0AAV5ALQ5_9AGAM|nr:hypothetical protein Clacol_008047 [Clathrus columnatus]